MKKIYNFLLCLLALTDLTFAQGPNDLNEGFHLGYSAGTNAFTISWWGRSNRNYFVQQTDDLKNWIYLPSMGSGSNQVIQWGVTSSSIKSFFRLQFDNDLNGLPDAWEKAFYGHTGINSNLLASRGDGLSILQSFQQGLNPNDIYNVSPVTILPVVNLTTSAASTLTAPANVTLTASASESNGTIGRVDFYQEGGYLGSCYTPPYSLQLSNLNAGAYFFNAVAVDATGQAASSGNVSVVVTPPITSASSNRYSRGSGTDPDFLSYLVAVNFEQGILLDATGNNFSKFPVAGNDPAKLPWFLRIQKSMAYQISYNPDSLTYSYPTSLAFENPLVAFGSGAGCTPLYVGQSYSFGIGTGGGYASANPIQDFNIQVYQDTAFSGTQVNIAPTIPLSLQLPRPGTPAWETFAANGYVKEQIVNDLSGNLIFKIAIQFVSGVSSADQWGQSGQPPLLVTVTAYTANYYLKISTIGETINKQNSTVYWMAVSNPNDPNVLGVNPTATTSGTYSTSFTMDFQQQPPWRSVFVGQPSFSGIPLPSSYLGKSLSELLHNSPWVSDSLSTPTSGTLTDIDSSPELDQHPALDSFVNSMGSIADQNAWALALVNYVTNEIELTDAISYNDNGSMSEQSINEGGVNRGALATFMEGQGSPTEQCALLIYMLRKAGINCGYVFAPHNSMLMLDQQLSNLLRMQIKGATDSLGNTNVPTLIPVNYPWVAAYINNKWVHLFPWMKDTSIVEGQDLYQYLPDGYNTGRQWLVKYLLNDPSVRNPYNVTNGPGFDNPGQLFPLYIKKQLETNYPNVSIDQLGVKIYNRRNYYTNWSDLPRPWQTPVITNDCLVDNLSSIPNLFDTMNVQVYSDRNNNGVPEASELLMSTGTMRMMDLHNRRFLLYTVQKGATNTHILKLSLEGFRALSTSPGSFTATDNMMGSQLLTADLTGTDDNLLFSIDYKRHRSLGGTINSLNPFLGVDDFLEYSDTRPLRKGDMAALVLDYGRVTSAMLDVHAQKYQAAQSSGTSVDPEITQGIPTYMMGISYYFNISQSKQNLLDLTKSNMISFFGHGFSKLGALRDSSGNLYNNGQIILKNPKVDMSFKRMAMVNNGTLHPNSGYTEINALNDWMPVFIGELSAQEHKTINQFFNKTDAVSTVKLLDIAQGKTPGSNLITIDSSNCDVNNPSSPLYNSFNNYYINISGTWSSYSNYYFNVLYPNKPVTAPLLPPAPAQSLARLLGCQPTPAPQLLTTATGNFLQYSPLVQQNPNSLYQQILSQFSNWDGNYVQVFLTPGPVTGASGAYQGIGAMVIGKESFYAYITDNLNLSNGGWASSLSTSLDSSFTSLTTWTPYKTTQGYSFNYLSNSVSTPPPDYNSNSFSLSGFSNGYSQIASGAFNLSDPVTNLILNQSTQLLGSNPQGSGNLLLANETKQLKEIGSFSLSSYFGAMFNSVPSAALDPVNTITGEFYIDALDLQLYGPMGLKIRRNYSSQSLADGGFGYGWKFAYEPYLVVAPTITSSTTTNRSGIIITTTTNNTFIYACEQDGSVISYRRTSAGSTQWVPKIADNPQLSNMQGDSAGSVSNLFNNRIDMTTSGTNTIYTLSGADGSVRTFMVRSYPTGGTNGLSRTRPYLQKWQDNRGNFYTFSFGQDSAATDWGLLNRITSSNGTFAGFTYDAYGHVSQAFTSDGRRLYYQYDEYGDLIKVTLPDASTIGYQYSHQPNVTGSTGTYSDHLIVEEDKPGGRILKNVYTSGTDRRVISQQSTSGSNFSLITSGSFTYVNTTGTDGVSGYTTVANAQGKVTRYEYTSSLLTKVIDPLNQIITQTWYAPNDASTGAYQRSLKSRSDKRGLLTEFQYDKQGNLIQNKLTGDLKGNGTSDVAITSSTYNSRNLLTQSTDPAGITTTINYDPNYQYLPAQIIKSNSTGTISTTAYTYQNVPASSGSGGAFGVLLSSTVAAGTSDAAVTNYVNISSGFPTKITRPTGTSDPDVVVNYTYDQRGQVTSETDALGRSTKYAYDARCNRIWSERHDETGAIVSWHYDYFNQNGEIEWSQGSRYNPEDYVLHQYDGDGRVSQEIKWRSQGSSNGGGVQSVQGIDDAYATTIFSHDNLGNLTEIHDPRHNSTIMTYDDAGQMLSRSKFSGFITGSGSNAIASEGFLYEPGGEVRQYTNPLGGVTTKAYTATGKLKDQKDLVTGVDLQFRYDLVGRLTTETLGNGTQWRTVYNDNLRTVTRTLYKSDLTTALATETTVFDRRGNVVSKTDRENNTFTNTYDALNRIKTATGPSSTSSTVQESVTHTYGAGDKVHIVTDALGQKTHTQNDAEGRPVFVQVKDKYNTIVRQTNYAYSPDHNSVTVTEGLGANSISTTTMTDTFGNPVIIKHGDGTFKLMAYDSCGNLVSSQDENNCVTINSYDALNRLYTQTLPSQASTVGATTTFIYDSAGNLTQRIMPGGQTHWQTYDFASRKTGEYLLGASGSTTRNFSYTYYPGGNAGLPQTTTDKLGVTFTTFYDDFMRPQTLTTAGSQPAQSGTTTYSFDNLNRLKTVVQNSAGNLTQVQRTFDAYGHIATELVSLNGTALNQFNQTWNGAGKRSSLVSQLTAQGLGAGLATGYAYWPDGLLRQEAVAGGNFYFNYGTNSLLTSRQNPGRTQTITSRDLLGRILTQQNSDSFSESQTWISRGQRSSYAATKSGLDWNGAAVWSGSSNYYYNYRGQLYSESDLANNGAYGDYQYRFDNEPVSASLPTGAGLGVRTSAVRRNNPGNYTDNLTGSWLVTGADSFKRPLNEQTFTSTNAGVPLQETYDYLGNELTRQLPNGNNQVLTWDAFGRLVKVAERDSSGSNGFDWTANYDGLGRRLQTNAVPVGSGSPQVTQPTTITSYYDPQVEFLELGVSVNGTRTWKVYGPDLSGRYGTLQGIGGLEATIDETTGNITTLVNDVFGNVVGLTYVGSLMASWGGSINIGAILSGTDTSNSPPVTAASMVWNPALVNGYGVLPGSTAPILSGSVNLTQATLWRSQRIDPTGFYYMGARYYEPNSGRFVCPDPLGHSASMDLYSYAGGDPVNGLDPTGRCKQEVPNGALVDSQGNLINGNVQIECGSPLPNALKPFNPNENPFPTYPNETTLGNVELGVANGTFLPLLQLAGKGDIALGQLTGNSWQVQYGQGELQMAQNIAKSTGGNPYSGAYYTTYGATMIGTILIPGEQEGAIIDTFEILDGVRRAKAAQILGQDTIVAKMLSNGSVQTFDVPISSLLSPKTSINVNGVIDAQRFSTTLEKTRIAPVSSENAIWIQPGTKGTSIPAVTIDYGR